MDEKQVIALIKKEIDENRTIALILKTIGLHTDSLQSCVERIMTLEQRLDDLTSK